MLLELLLLEERRWGRRRSALSEGRLMLDEPFQGFAHLGGELALGCDLALVNEGTMTSISVLRVGFYRAVLETGGLQAVKCFRGIQEKSKGDVLKDPQ